MSCERRECDVLVVGGGSAGVAAAVAAGRLGCRTVILERYGFLGGLASSAWVGTVCGLYLSGGAEPRFVQRGFPVELAEALRQAGAPAPQSFAEGLWFLPYDPVGFRLVSDRLVSEAGAEVSAHACVCAVEASGDAIRSVRAIAWNKPIEIRARAYVDCSGESILSTLAGGELAPDESRQAGAAVFELDGIAEMEPQLLGRAIFKHVISAVGDGRLPRDAERISLVPGSFRNGRALLKLSLPAARDGDASTISRLEREARGLAGTIAALLGEAEDLGRCRLSGLPPQIGIRTGRRPRGLALLEEADVLGARKRDDAIANAAWPIEQWGEARQPFMSYVGDGEYYQIPYGAIVSRSFSNLFFAGRCLSASERAIASARVIGTCLATGYAAGAAAGLLAGGRDPGEAVGRLASDLR